MRTIEKRFLGIYKKEKYVFISKNLQHIEIAVTTTLFGRWVIQEDFREVYVPALTHEDAEGLRVIAEAYTELLEVARKLQEEEIN